jgi:hypothetical protein
MPWWTRSWGVADSAPANEARLGAHAYSLLERVCHLHNMSGRMPMGSEPQASCTFAFGNPDGSVVNLRLSLAIDGYGDASARG